MERLQTHLDKKKVDLTGGESVYCINQSQMKLAKKFLSEDAANHPELKTIFDSSIADLTRNEQAALAFLLVDHLNTSPRV